MQAEFKLHPAQVAPWGKPAADPRRDALGRFAPALMNKPAPAAATKPEAPPFMASLSFVATAVPGCCSLVTLHSVMPSKENGTGPYANYLTYEEQLKHEPTESEGKALRDKVVAAVRKANNRGRVSAECQILERSGGGAEGNVLVRKLLLKAGFVRTHSFTGCYGNKVGVYFLAGNGGLEISKPETKEP